MIQNGSQGLYSKGSVRKVKKFSGLKQSILVRPGAGLLAGARRRKPSNKISKMIPQLTVPG